MLFNKAQNAVEANIKTLMANKKKEHELRLKKAIAQDTIRRGAREAAATR
jgi:hypothetical protein